ncbi:MAG: hypothetical protein AAF219_10775 [Myxococcota bacterium]
MASKSMDYDEDDSEDRFLHDGQELTVLRGQRAETLHSSRAFYSAQSFAYRPNTSIVRDDAAYPLVGLVQAPRGNEVDAERILDDIQWVTTRIVRGMVTRALRATRDPLRLVLTGFGPYQDEEAATVYQNLTGVFVSSPAHLRTMIRRAFPDLLAPGGGKQRDHQHDVVSEFSLIDPHHRLGRQLTVIARSLLVDDHSPLDDPNSGILPLLQTHQPQMVVMLGTRPHGAVEFLIDEVSDDRGPSASSASLSGGHGHPLNRAGARSFSRGLLELGPA